MVVLRKCKKQQNRLVEPKNSKYLLLSLCEHFNQMACLMQLYFALRYSMSPNISQMVVMNCIALSVVRARVFCCGAIWFPFILMCLWHQENCWDSRGKCLQLGLQPELRIFMFSDNYLFFPSKKRYGPKMVSMLRF